MRGGKETIVRWSVVLQTSNEALEKRIRKSQSSFQRLFFSLRFFINVLLLSLINIVVVVAYSTAKGFELFHSLGNDGYQSSYTSYRRWQRRLRLSTAGSLAVILLMTVFSGSLFSLTQSQAASVSVTCSGADSDNPTAVDVSGYSSATDLTLEDSSPSDDTYVYCEMDLSGLLELNSLTIGAEVRLQHPQGDPVGLQIKANNITIEDDAQINVVGFGCSGGTGDSDGYGPDLTQADPDDATCLISTAGYGDGHTTGAGAGGSYGGNARKNSTDTSTGVTYGSTAAPQYLGSGGGDGLGTLSVGGNGGGRVYLEVSGTLDHRGWIGANGNSGTQHTSGNVGGGGSGGSIYIITNDIKGDGSTAVRGGNSASGGGLGGGSGRVAIYYATNNVTEDSGQDYGFYNNLTPKNNGSTTYVGQGGTEYIQQIEAPVTPSITTPTNGATSEGTSVTLTSSAFNAQDDSTDHVDPVGHTSTDWKVKTDSDCSSDSNVTWSSLDDTSNLESVTVGTTLTNGNTYYACVRHTNFVGDSSWSTASTFTVIASGLSESTSTIDYDDEGQYSAGSNISFSGSAVTATTAAWYHDFWTRRKAITITEQDGVALTDFQVRIPVTYDADMKTAFEDIRFTDSDGVTDLSFWRQEKQDSTSAVFWVNVPSIGASAAETIYMYYGNSSALDNAQSASDTFIYFDDFSGDLSAWDTANADGNWSISSGALYSDNIGNTGDYIQYGSPMPPDDFVISAKGQSIDSAGFENFYALTHLDVVDDDGDGYQAGAAVGSDQWRIQDANIPTSVQSSITSTGDTFNADEYYEFDVKFEDSNTISVLSQGVEKITPQTMLEYQFTPGLSDIKAEVLFDDYRIRKFAATEPTVAVGAEVTTIDNTTLRVINSSGDTYSDLYNFTETANTNGEVKYQVSADNINWLYYDTVGGSWSSASEGALTMANTAEEMDAFLNEFSTDGSLYIAAYLMPDDGGTLQLSNVDATYVNNSPPDQPSIAAPINGASNVSRTPSIDASAFSGAGSHVNSDWKVQTGSDCSTDTGVAWSSNTDSTNKTSHTVASLLAKSTTYYICTRHRNANGASNWGSASFTTRANAAPTASIGSVGSPTEDDGSVSLSASVSDDDSDDSHTYSWTEISDSGDACSLSNNTSATPTVTIGNKDSNYSCQYQVTVDDGTTTDTEIVTMNITADNDAPSVATLSDKSVNEGDQLQFAVAASDEDSASVELSAQDPDSDFADNSITVSSLFSDNGDNTGTFTWTPESNQSGSYVARIDASDGTTTATELVTITVADTQTTGDNTAPTFGDNRLPNVSFAAGVRTTVLFDLDEYFTDADGDTLTYSATGNERIDVYIDEEGQVTMEALASFAGSEALNFVATDPSEDTATSSAVIVTVTETIPEDDINAVIGKSKGKGVITVKDAEGNEVAQWQAFKKGGVIPRVETVQDNTYVFAVKRRSGSTTHAYTSQGNILKKKRLSPKLHFRKMSTGQLDDNKKNVEIVVATKRGSTVYFKIFSFNPNNKRYVLRKRTKYRGIKGKKFRTTIQKKRIKLINKKGKTKFIWTPFK